MADHRGHNPSIERFRAYAIDRMIDVRVAAAAIQREDLFPALSESQRSNLSLIILELGTNIVKYAGSGRILLRSLCSRRRHAVEVLAVDQGPGIADIQQALQDHFTTGNTLGLGLGSVQRLASEFAIDCPEGGGTRVRVMLWASEAAAPIPSAKGGRSASASRTPLPSTAPVSEPGLPLLGISTLERNRPALHQSLSGDCLLQRDHGHLAVRLLLDGTGHGVDAHRIAVQAAGAIDQNLDQQFAAMTPAPDGLDIGTLIVDALQAGHQRIRGSRGAAVGLAVIDRRSRCLHFAGIGNTRILLLACRGWEGVSRDGQLGVSFRRPVIQCFSLAPGDVVIQTSDGIRASSLRALRPGRPGVAVEPEQVIRDLLAQTPFTDDVSMLVSRCLA